MRTAIGLMSGTSLDGVDAALIVTDGVRVRHRGPALTLPYAGDFRARLRAALGEEGPLPELERDLTMIHARAVERLLDLAGGRTADVVGFHGQTIFHRPAEGRTRQIGDAALLSRMTGMPVVNDFRSADVEAGGQGAPLVPVYHAALAGELEKPLAILNIGGVANLTWIGPGGELLAFDTGPGNAPLDDWLFRHTGVAMDLDGRLAASGRIDETAMAAFLRHPYFALRPPKSLDRDDFNRLIGELTDHLSPADGAASRAAFCAAAVAAACGHLPSPPRRWLVTGGGRHNPFIMRQLSERLGAPVEPVEAEGWNGDAMEAEAFALLAVRSLRGLPLTFPGTTGVKAPLAGGQVCGPAGSGRSRKDRP